MIKKILAALDGSAYTKAVTGYGIWLSKGFDADLTGLYVIDLVALEGPFLHDLSGSLGFEPFLNFSTKMREALEASGRTVLESFVEECGKEGVDAETLLAYGIVSNEICDKARLNDLVLIGRRGVNAEFEHGLLGSVTEGVMRKSSRPVLVVPETFSTPQKPLLCYDSSPNSTKAMHSAAEFVKALGLELTVITAERDGETASSVLEEAEDYLKSYGVDASFVHVDEDAPVGLENYYRKNGHDLIFMGATRHSGILKMVLGSTTEHVIRTVEGPFFLER